MKLGLFLLAVAVVLGGLVGMLVVRDPGYVLVAYADAAIETSLWFALVLLGLVYLAIRGTIFVFARSVASRSKVGRWLRERKGDSARQQSVRGMLLMAEGRWAQARKLLTSAAPQAPSALVNYLTAARAAHEMGDIDGRDELLRLAHESTPGSRFAVGLTQAQLQMSNAQWEQCLATLLQLSKEQPRHALVLEMLARCYQQLGDWLGLLALGADLKKTRALTDEALQALLLQAWEQTLASGEEPASAVWARIPKELKRSTALVAAYARAEQAGGANAQAAASIRLALQRDWDEQLVSLYGQVRTDNPAEQLKVAESWLKDRPGDAGLLLALGRIALMSEQWAKAREYLESSLRLAKSAEVYAELGRLCAAMGEVERGNEYLLRSLPDLPDLPLPHGG
jgi:HemY protein